MATKRQEELLVVRELRRGKPTSAWTRFNVDHGLALLMLILIVGVAIAVVARSWSLLTVAIVVSACSIIRLVRIRRMGKGITGVS